MSWFCNSLNVTANKLFKCLQVVIACAFLVVVHPPSANATTAGGDGAAGDAGDGTGAERVTVEIKKSVYMRYSTTSLKKVAGDIVKKYRPGFYTVQLEGLTKRQSISVMFIAAVLNPRIARRLMRRLARAKTEKKRLKIISDEIKRLKFQQKVAESLGQTGNAQVIGNIILVLQEGTF